MTAVPSRTATSSAMASSKDSPSKRARMALRSRAVSLVDHASGKLTKRLAVCPWASVTVPSARVAQWMTRP